MNNILISDETTKLVVKIRWEMSTHNNTYVDPRSVSFAKIFIFVVNFKTNTDSFNVGYAPFHLSHNAVLRDFATSEKDIFV